MDASIIRLSADGAAYTYSNRNQMQKCGLVFIFKLAPVPITQNILEYIPTARIETSFPFLIWTGYLRRLSAALHKPNCLNHSQLSRST